MLKVKSKEPIPVEHLEKFKKNDRYKMTTFEESLNQLKLELVKQQPAIGKEYDGVATHIIDVSNFYIVPLPCYQLVSVLEKPGPLYNQDITKGSIVIYMSPTLKQHVRGEVRTLNHNMAHDMYAMDYGFLDKSVPSKDLYSPLRDEVKNIPALAKLCELSMCYPRHRDFSEQAINDFKFLMGQKGERLSITIKRNSNNKLGVFVMSSETNPDDVSACMAHVGHSALYAFVS